MVDNNENTGPVSKNLRSAIVRENHLDFLHNLHLQGISVGIENVNKLKENGYIKEEVKQITPPVFTDNINPFHLENNTEEQKKVDANIDIVIESSPEVTQKAFEILTDIELEHRRKSHDHIFEGRDTEINSDEWKPKSTIDHEQDFIDWINSINQLGFQNKVRYKKFSLYCQQAYTWLQDKKSHSDFLDEDELIDYEDEEIRRCNENSLYLLNKYVWYKEGNVEEGKVKYIAAPAHEVLCYMNDCGYSIGLAKGRQMAATTTIMSLNMKDVIFKKNHFMKFVTEDDVKAKEIFEDKLKFAFSEMQWWLKPNVINERDNLFATGTKPEKGTKEGAGARILVVVPKRTAIAGGAPQKVMIDEAGNIPVLGEMLNNIRPTMLFADPKTRKIIVKRILWFWGCVCAGTKVWTNDGRLINIEDLKQEEGIIGFDKEKGLASKEKITYWQPPFEKPCYRITTNKGSKLECSDNHPILARVKKEDGYFKKNDFVEAKDIKVGDHLSIIDSVEIYGENKMWEPRVVGWLIGDGTYGIDHSPRMANCDDEINEYLEKNLDARVLLSRLTIDGRTYKEIRLKGVCGELRKLGIYGQTKLKKTLPINSHSYTKSDICELLGGIFDTDGCVHYKEKSTKQIDLTSSSEALLTEIKLLLIKLGIHCNISRIKANTLTNKRDKNDWFVLYIADSRSINKFYENISFKIKYKQERLESIVESIKLRRRKVVKGSEGLRFETVVNVEYIGIKPVYNLTAGTTHTYIANGIVTHNTGGQMEKGGKSFEVELLSLFKQWNEGNYGSGIIPIFFNWTCRPYATQADYDRERLIAYSKLNQDEIEGQKAVTEFHQTWPNSLSDVFMGSSKTLVSSEYIDKALQRIQKAKKEHNYQLHQSGFFEPIFDFNTPTAEGAHQPYKIIGANFIPTSDIDSRASTTIFMQPDKTWQNRYFKGTDPIDTDTGLSNFASTVWDKWFKTPVAIMNWRTRDYKDAFMQSLLLNLYYDTSKEQEGVWELVESNRGTSYTQYVENAGYGKKFVLNYQLPHAIQNRTTINEGVGIDNKGVRNTMIINHLHSMLSAYGDKIYLDIIFEQLKTFVCNVSDKGKEMWGPMNKKYFKDDTLFSTVFSYICAELCFYDTEPINTLKKSNGFRIEYKIDYDKDYRLVRRPIKVAN